MADITRAWLGTPRLSKRDGAGSTSLTLTVCVVVVFFVFFCNAGLVPEPTVQREADEAAERPRRTAARLLQGPEEDEAPGRPAGGPGHSRTRGLWILRR